MDGTLIFDTKIDKTGAMNGMDALQSSMATRLTTIGGKFQATGAVMTLGLTTPLLFAAKGMVSAASDFEENLNKIDVAFKNDAQVVKDWAENAGKQFGLSRNQSMNTTATFGDMATSMGINTDEAAKMSTGLAGLGGDLASFKNIPVDQAMTALNGVFTGETESLKQLGIIMSETNLEEFAAKTGKSYKEMSQAEKVQLRYNYVLDKTKNAQGDYARTSDGTANTLRGFQVAVEELQIAFGQHLLPTLTPIVSKLNDMIMAFANSPPFVKKLVIGFGLLLAAAGPLLAITGTLMKVIGGGMNIWAKITGKVVADSLATGANTAAKTANATATTTAGNAQKFLNRALAAAKFAIMIAALIAVVALIKMFSTDSEAAKEKLAGFATKITDMFGKVAAMVPTIISTISTMLPKLIEAGGNILDKLIDGIISNLPQVLSAVKKIIKTVADLIITNLPKILKAGVEILKAIIQGVLEALPILMDMLPSLLETIATILIENLPMILEAGLQILVGLIEGIMEALPQLIAMLPKIITTIMDILVASLPIIIEVGIKLLLALIAGLVVALPQLISMLPSIINTIISIIIANLPIIIDAGIQILIAIIGGLIQAIPQLVAALPQIISALVSGILALAWQLIKLGGQLVGKFLGGLKEKIGDIWAWAKSIPVKIAAKIKESWGSIKTVGGDLVKGLWNGITGKLDWILDKIKGFGKKILGGLKAFFKIKSPSRLFEKVLGFNLVFGIGRGIMKKTRWVVGKAVKQARALTGAYENELNAFDAFNAETTLTSKAPILTGIDGQKAEQNAGNTYVTQKVEISQPVKTPAETARAIRNSFKYGLVGV